MEEEAFLLIVTNGKDEDGFPVESLERIPVYVRERSVKRTEFYKALEVGTKLRTTFLIRWEDWEQSKHLDAEGRKTYATQIECDGEVYEIIRTYRTNRGSVEVMCR